MSQSHETRTDYGQSTLTSTVQRIQPHPTIDNASLLVTAASCFHPADFQWPDQPGDRGEAGFHGQKVAISDCQVAAIEEQTGEFYLDTNIPVKRGESGWVFCVAHQLASPINTLSLNVGDPIILQLDTEYRASLSLVHSACHLMSLALNRSLASYWSKSVVLDAMGTPDFDRLAIERSRIEPFKSIDQYRLGKSLRKNGFNKSELLNTLSQLEITINQQLYRWLGTAESIHTTQQGDFLLSRKQWQTRLDQQIVSIPCGGTHCENLSQLTGMQVSLEITDSDNSLIATTSLIHR